MRKPTFQLLPDNYQPPQDIHFISIDFGPFPVIITEPINVIYFKNQMDKKDPREVANPVTKSAESPAAQETSGMLDQNIPLSPREIQYSKQISILRKERSEMEGDIRTVVKVFADVLKELGIDPKMFSDSDVTANLPAIIGKLTMKMSSGMVDFEAFAQVSAVGSIIEKYNPLVEDILP